ncbi:MAG: metal-dependent transcriptional regulator [Methanomicrobiales archaeon]|nr:metal-dependent transcriptional regulator [Methanomicrobiales archaeon]
MQPSDLEDCLEAILLKIQDNNVPFTAEELAQAVPGAPAGATLVASLERAGYVRRGPDGTYTLTPAGRTLGERIVRKHRTLECFFTEMLGMDAETASEEACRLEHEISDETISRLSEYIENPPRPCVRYGWRHAFRPQECMQPATVLDFSEGSRLKVLLVGSPGANRRLIDLGVIPGAVLEIRRRLRNGSVVVKVKGCDVALSPEIARCIHVEPFG